ncbi:lasso RiPP family leader peptide-containing protein [Saccharothrix obliqua]|nr:lasso RiPP family leader peptide-containing protein [Saccharothrix obliqua]MBW4719106.1 lasso RiPP family leader peptide-containing protein [Saccharothrix obliqua]
MDTTPRPYQRPVLVKAGEFGNDTLGPRGPRPDFRRRRPRF